MRRELNVLVSIRSDSISRTTVGREGAGADDDRVAEHAQLVSETQLDRYRGQAGTADPGVLVGGVEGGHSASR